MNKALLRLSAGLLVLLAAASLGSAMTAGNTVPASNLGRIAPVSINAAKLAPPECASIAAGLTAIVSVTGGNANELVLGTAGVDDMSGGQGNDCLVGGAGNDALDGTQGTDVCVGGLGTDTFHARCETAIQ